MLKKKIYFMYLDQGATSSSPLQTSHHSIQIDLFLQEAALQSPPPIHSPETPQNPSEVLVP